MGLIEVLKERSQQAEALSQDAFREARRLAKALRERHDFDSLYLCGSLLKGKFSARSDIDLIVKGMDVKDFFKALAYLLSESRYGIDFKPWEDLEEDFKERVLKEGMRLI